MKPGKVVLTDFDRLLASDSRTPGNPELPEGSRARVLEELERIVVSRGKLHEHIRALYQRVGRSLRHDALLPKEVEEAAIREGLAALDDAALASVALNPFALFALQDALYKAVEDWANGVQDAAVSPAWWKAMGREGRAMIDRRSVSLIEEALRREGLLGECPGSPEESQQ